jgi:hypothetical protein
MLYRMGMGWRAAIAGAFIAIIWLATVAVIAS